MSIIDFMISGKREETKRKGQEKEGEKQQKTEERERGDKKSSLPILLRFLVILLLRSS